MTEFVLEQKPMLTELVNSFFPNRADREDALQEVYIKFLHVDFSAMETPHAWLYRSATNLFKDILRKQRSDMEWDQYAATGEDEYAESPLDIYLAEEENAEAFTSLDDAPADLAIVGKLYYFQGKTYNQIAEELALPPGTVASRMSTLRRYLAS